MAARVSAPDAATRDAVLAEAQALRRAGRLVEALATLARLEKAWPRFSRLHQERGQCQIALRNAPAAIAALERAVALNPTLPASWHMLAQLHAHAGDSARAGQARQRLAVLEHWPPALVMAGSLHADGDLGPAEQVLRDYLAQDGANVGALRLLARICVDDGRSAEAVTVLRHALAQAPDYHAARQDLATVLLDRQEHAQARAEAATLLAAQPADRAARKLHAAACVALGDHEAVIDPYTQLLAEGTASPTEAAELLAWRANALKICGRTEEAIADYRAAIAARGDGYGVAWFGLANLKTYRFTVTEVARMEAAAADPALAGQDRIYLAFALGKAFEDRGTPDTAWNWYARGNALEHRRHGWSADAADAAVERMRVAFTQVLPLSAAEAPGEATPIFIVGLPRSGSTLVEQILASHPEVEGTQELTEIGRLSAEVCGSDPACDLPLAPQALARLDPCELRMLGQRYLEDTRVYRRLGRACFIDKMPANFWHLGLIAHALPQARIIDVRRGAMACCFSNFKQLFGPAHNRFAYDLATLGRYYRTYKAMMAHWQRVLPGRVLRMDHEALVADLEGSVRRLLAHCGLAFDPACLRFHETRRPVRTPSSEQVRRPIDAAGLDQWRAFAPWLDPLRDALGTARDDPGS